MVSMLSKDVEDLLSDAQRKLGEQVLLESEKGTTWDRRARILFYGTLIKVFKERYHLDEGTAKHYIYVEGINPFEGKKGGTIFGSNLYPDAIIICDDGPKIAIELDHGHSGSRIKNALTKAGVLKLVGEFDKIAVFFFAYPPLSPENINKGKAEEIVLEFFRKNLSTLLFLVRPRISSGL